MQFVLISAGFCIGKDMVSNSRSLSIIADTEEDSLFCVKKCPYYNFETDSYISGITIPKAIEGRNKNLTSILKDVTDSISCKYKYIENELILIMDIIVDSQGIVRGAIVTKKSIHNNIELEITKYALHLFKNEQYVPAFHRKPITYFFPFIFKKNFQHQRD